MLTINISIPMGITIKSIIIFPRSLKYSQSYHIHPYSIHSQLPSYRHNIPCVLTIPYTFPLHSPVWMEEILHELIGGLSHYRVISILSLPQDFATIQNSCGNQCHRYSLQIFAIHISHTFPLHIIGLRQLAYKCKNSRVYCSYNQGYKQTYDQGAPHCRG